MADEYDAILEVQIFSGIALFVCTTLNLSFFLPAAFQFFFWMTDPFIFGNRSKSWTTSDWNLTTHNGEPGGGGQHQVFWGAPQHSFQNDARRAFLVATPHTIFAYNHPIVVVICAKMR